MTAWSEPIALRETGRYCHIRDVSRLSRRQAAVALSRSIRMTVTTTTGGLCVAGMVDLTDDGQTWCASWVPEWDAAGWRARGTTAIDALRALRDVVIRARILGHEGDRMDVLRALRGLP